MTDKTPATEAGLSHEHQEGMAYDDRCPVCRAGVRLHPGQHEFRTICRLCGEYGMLHVSVITDNERVTITDSRVPSDD